MESTVQVRSKLFMVYGDYLVTDLSEREKDQCIASLDSGQPYNTNMTKTFLMDDSFVFAYTERTGDFICSSGGEGKKYPLVKKDARRLTAWIEPILSSKGYQKTVAAQPVSTLKSKAGGRAAAGIFFTALLVFLAVGSRRYTSRNPIAFVVLDLLRNLGPVLTAVIGLGITLLATFAALRRVKTGDNVVTFRRTAS